MAKIPELSDLFLAAADIEVETPITVGVGKVDSKGRFLIPQFAKAWTWAAWADSFPIKEMMRLKFSLPTADSAAEAILRFFGVPTPDAWQASWGEFAVQYRQTQKFEINQLALAAWVREAELIAKEIPLKEFDKAKLRASLEELRQLTAGDVQKGLDRAQVICASFGVALVVVPELPGTRISGCARWLDDRHAMVGLTLRYKWADQLWFTFFHELAHILLHRTRHMFVIDNAAKYMGDEVVDSGMAEYEEEADRFAADTLIPPDALAGFLRHTANGLTNDQYNAAVKDLAKSLGIGPGIVIGRLQHDKVLKPSQGVRLKQKLDWGFVTED